MEDPKAVYGMVGKSQASARRERERERTLTFDFVPYAYEESDASGTVGGAPFHVDYDKGTQANLSDC
eukprot:3800997-Prorocentrum_lima.AAC.1